MKRTFMRSALMMVLGLMISAMTFGQAITITGTVTDAADGSTLPGVSIIVKGTTRGVTTDINGAYSLNASPGETVVYSFVGYTTQEILVGTARVINVQLSTSLTMLDEAVIVAYGTRKKSDLTGAITSITAKDFQKGALASSEQLMQGKVAGLQITTGGGSAGGGSTIRIRGGASLNASNDPLIVIDGVPVESNAIAGSANLLNTINPNDIESVSVLKDASATALYGSRASNGVIIITTKKGESGKARFNFNTQGSYGIVSDYVNVLSAEEFASAVRATGDQAYINLLGTSNTDWQREIYRPAFGADVNGSVSGTLADLLPYRLSLGYLDQAGVLQTNHFDRKTVALNLSPKFFNNNLSVNLNAKYTNTGNRFADEGAVGSAVNFDPTQPIEDGGKFGGYYEWLAANGNPINTNGPATKPNPLGLLMLRENMSNVNRFIGNLQLEYRLPFFPELKLQTNLGLDNAAGKGNDNIFANSSIAYHKNGIYGEYKQEKRNTLADVGMLYEKNFGGNSNMDVLLLHSYQDFTTFGYNFAKYDQAGVVDPTTVPTFDTDKPQYRLESYLGRVNFTLLNKYLITGSVRSDASSKFAPGNRTGIFPAIALGWKLNEELFPGNDNINELKLRFGWGKTGQQDVNNLYPYMARYSQSATTAQYQFGDQFYSFLRPAAYDPNLKWETTVTTNVGLDFGFFENRLTGNVELYKKDTKDLLSVIDIAPGANFDISLLTNVGNMENRGFELTLGTTPLRTNRITWNIGGNFTLNETKITNLLKNEDPNFPGINVSGISGGTGNSIGKFDIGFAPYAYNVFKQVYDAGGNPIEGLYEDLNRDGIINDNDRYLYKKPAADALLGFSTNVVIDKFTFGLAGHGMIGNYLYNNYFSSQGAERNLNDPLHFLSNVPANYLETGFYNNQYLSDYYIENASFFRLDNINLGYNFGRITDAFNLVLNAGVQNVFVVTKYKGLDPENSSPTGVDNLIYPRPRVFSIGLNFDFN